MYIVTAETIKTNTILSNITNKLNKFKKKIHSQKKMGSF